MEVFRESFMYVAALAVDLTVDPQLESELILRFREGWFASATMMPPHQNKSLDDVASAFRKSAECAFLRQEN